jgi:dipeptidyl aminopeptidase/acylaminoacyl peptidase
MYRAAIQRRRLLERGGRGLIWFFLLLCLMSCGVPKSSPRERALDALSFRDIAPRWSHDGRYIAFLRALSDGRYQLCVVDAKLRHVVPLLRPEIINPDRPFDASRESYSSPDRLSWSPNDRQLAIERTEWFRFEDGERMPGTGLWLLDIASGALAPLALHKTPYHSLFYFYHTPVWSPDGRYVAFVGEGVNGQRAIFVHPLHAHQLPQEIPPRFDAYTQSDWPVWRPTLPSRADPQPVLAFRQGIVHALAAPNTETIRRLQPGSARPGAAAEIVRVRAGDYLATLPTKPRFSNIALRISDIVWRPDGRALAFVLTPDALNFHRYEIWMVDARGRHLRRISPRDGKGYFAPEWIGKDKVGALSPHGSRFDVVVFDLSTGHHWVVGTIDSADIDWSPDRAYIVYATARNRPLAEGRTTLKLLETGLYATTEVASARVPLGLPFKKE